MKPQKHYFLVRINRQEQKDREEKIGSIYIPTNAVYMTRCMENAEIMGIGDRAHEEFPEAKVGDKLLIHHFIEGDEEDAYLVDYDDKYRYYVVPAHEYNGEKSMAYGVYDGNTIIPHKDYVFLEEEVPEENKLPMKEAIDQAITTTSSGLYIFKEWKETRDSDEDKMKKLEQDNIQLGGNLQNPRIDAGRKAEAMAQIKRNEAEIAFLSKKVNKQKYLPYHIAYSNPVMNKWFDAKIKPKDILYVLNYAAKTITEFMDKRYIVASAEYIGFLYK